MFNVCTAIQLPVFWITVQSYNRWKLSVGQGLPIASMNNLFYAFFGEVVVFTAIGVGVHHFHFPIANTIVEQCPDTIIPRIERFVSSISHK